VNKVKYETHIEPFLGYIEKWCEEGFSEEVISSNLNISYPFFRTCKKKYKSLTTVLTRTRAKKTIEIEKSLYKRSLGFEIEEVQEEYENDELKRTKKTKKYIPASVDAISFYLRNKATKDYAVLESRKLDLEEKKIQLEKAKFEFEKLKIQNVGENADNGNINEMFRALEQEQDQELAELQAIEKGAVDDIGGDTLCNGEFLEPNQENS
jgi:hypothetical protein